ncbi:MAG: SDR family NAD(P)-dependent oxidoreductase [Deferrisomatales bacterium]|nr:SDR family NAD(P)-dependent oxidoreductase [Deferrisomatales bacterium]
MSASRHCFPIIGDAALLADIINDHPSIERVVLKGCEASGLVGAETTLTLYSAAKEMRGSSSNVPDILVWGGVSTPEAAAAFLSTGAAGIVFESVHWLTDLVAVDSHQRRQLANLRLDSTELVGLELRTPWRLFNKGNSLAFQELRALESSLCRAGVTEESRRSFSSQVHGRAVHPLESRFAPDEVIPLAVEAAFAASFVERFGSGTEGAVGAFIEEIRSCCRLADAKRDGFLRSPVARELGTRYPFIQGAMASITDVPELAARVAAAGGLPTIALGLMDEEALDRRLGRLQEAMEGRPYAVNVIALAENRCRETHLAWIKKHRPRLVWVAGGDLSPVKELLELGLAVVYIAPDEALLTLALEAGVRWVVCEGYEAGGHVGPHSTLTLAQMVLELKRRKPSLFQGCRVILAGGIFNRETAFIAAMLGADAVQMGTAYLTSREMIETGALTALYQRLILESPLGGTVVSGQATGLRVRSLGTPRVAAILSLEREFAAGRQDERSFRTQTEEMTAGSLFTAARGLDRPGGTPLDEEACLERGRFLSGACAGLLREARDLESFHRELAESPLVLHQPFLGSNAGLSEPPPDASRSRGVPSPAVGHWTSQGGGAPTRGDRERVVVTGMSLVNALGKSPEEVWAASLALQSGITPVPPSRWDHERFYDPQPYAPDKTYCKVGAFVDFRVSRNGLGIPPHDFRTMTEATRLTLWLADGAIRASGILESGIPRERIGVLISQNSGEAAGPLTDLHIRAYVHDILADIRKAVPLTPEQLRAIERQVKSGRMAPDDTTLLGRLNCAAGGFVCNRYGFMGPSYSVSAACATSLVALHSAVQMIRNGIIDAAIVGGGEEPLTHLHFLEFSALGALYGLSGRERPPREASRPFDAERDGMVLGEGGGMIVIERESVARARGAPVHVVITGLGASNNHRGMVESSSATQALAMRTSFRDTPYGPDAVDLVECHGTSTRQGDVEEIRALKTFFPSSRRTVISSFKSQIGHTLGASGLNSLIRGVSAMNAGVFPPTLNYEHPDPDIALEGSGLLLPREPLDWKRRDGRPRRLQVNAFGFGGSNYVVQVEEDLDPAGTILVSPGSSPNLTEGTGGRSVLPGVSFLRDQLGGRNFRIGVVAPSEEDALSAIGSPAALAEAAVASPKAARSLARQGIFLGRDDAPALPLALVFPGQGSQYAGMGRDLYESSSVIREWMDRAAAAADFDLLDLLFRDREGDLQETRWQQPALFAVEHALARHLLALGVRPVAMAGHSLGELTALCLAGVYCVEDGFRIVNKRAICMDKAGALHGDPGVMAATDAPLELLQEMLRGRSDVHIGNINAPRQVVLSGKTDAIRALGVELKEGGYRFTLLRVSMAFHSPIMRVIHEELEAYVSSIPFHAPQIPVLSNTTMAPYPSDPTEIRRILMAHLESTVHWMSNVRALWNDYGVRLFVEVGPGDTLSDLITDTLAEPECIQTCLPAAEAPTYRTALARLFARGHLEVPREPRLVSHSAGRQGPTIGPPPGGPGVFEARQHVSPERPAAPPLDVAPAIPEPAAPLPAEAPEAQGLMERLIRIIMDATGYTREEIQPEMDLRRDLSIRSSRLPIIMDAAERLFGITIELEDFIEVRTVQDIADRISEIIGRQGGPGEGPAARAADPGAAPGAVPEPGPEEGDRANGVEDACLKRCVFTLAPVEPAASAPLALSPGDAVVLLSPDREDALARSADELLRKGTGVETVPLPYLPEHGGPGEEGPDLRTAAGVARLSERIAGLASRAGLVITLPRGRPQGLADMAEVARLLAGLFQLVQAFLQPPARKFVVLIHDTREEPDTPGRLLAEGLLGLFLSAAQEQPSTQFRTLEVDRDTDLPPALRAALDRGCPAVELVHREGGLLTSRAQAVPAVFGGAPSLELSPGDVVILSGGASGIGARLARGLAPFAPRLVLLGRTPPGPGPGPRPLESRPGSSSPPSAPEGSHAREIAQTLADLRASGIEATYLTCDVTDPEAVRAALGEVVERFGRIDGIIHGAGVLRDGLLADLTPEELSLVADVKFLGAWNLFTAAAGAGLRFFVGLSSVAAIQGNPGQTNYAAANRMMSALLPYLRAKNPAIHFKALMLPPIEGTGMAEDPEVRHALRRRGVAYIHVQELVALFCRELFVAPAEDVRVLFLRALPAVKAAPLGDFGRPPLRGRLDGGPVALSDRDFPLIDGISRLDLRRGHLEATRTFFDAHDLWLADHRPLKSLAHPLVSAAMMVETFLEAARILYPHLPVRGVRQVRFLDTISCPAGVSRPARISCRRVGAEPGAVVCEVSLSAQELSPTGRLPTRRLDERFTPYCTGQVVLGGGPAELAEWLQDFPVRPEELRTPPVPHGELLQWYERRTGLQGRYRVLEVLDGAGPRTVRGRTVYRETGDFAQLPAACYQYSPYLLEALMQLAGFHGPAMDPQDRRSMLPVGIGEMRFPRLCRPGEPITLEARLRAPAEDSLTWDARGVDAQGHTLMQVRTLRLQRASP